METVTEGCILSDTVWSETAVIISAVKFLQHAVSNSSCKTCMCCDIYDDGDTNSLYDIYIIKNKLFMFVFGREVEKDLRHFLFALALLAFPPSIPSLCLHTTHTVFIDYWQFLHGHSPNVYAAVLMTSQKRSLAQVYCKKALAAQMCTLGLGFGRDGWTVFRWGSYIHTLRHKHTHMCTRAHAACICYSSMSFKD